MNKRFLGIWIVSVAVMALLRLNVGYATAKECRHTVQHSVCNPWPMIKKDRNNFQLSYNITLHIPHSFQIKSNQMVHQITATWFKVDSIDINTIQTTPIIPFNSYRTAVENNLSVDAMSMSLQSLLTIKDVDNKDIGCYWCVVEIRVPNGCYQLQPSTKYCLFQKYSANYKFLIPCVNIPHMHNEANCTQANICKYQHHSNLLCAPVQHKVRGLRDTHTHNGTSSPQNSSYITNEDTPKGGMTMGLLTGIIICILLFVAIVVMLGTVVVLCKKKSINHPIEDGRGSKGLTHHTKDTARHARPSTAPNRENTATSIGAYYLLEMPPNQLKEDNKVSLSLHHPSSFLTDHPYTLCPPPSSHALHLTSTNSTLSRYASSTHTMTSSLTSSSSDSANHSSVHSGERNSGKRNQEIDREGNTVIDGCSKGESYIINAQNSGSIGVSSSISVTGCSNNGTAYGYSGDIGCSDIGKGNGGIDCSSNLNSTTCDGCSVSMACSGVVVGYKGGVVSYTDDIDGGGSRCDTVADVDGDKDSTEGNIGLKYNTVEDPNNSKPPSSQFHHYYILEEPCYQNWAVSSATIECPPSEARCNHRCNPLCAINIPNQKIRELLKISAAGDDEFDPALVLQLKAQLRSSCDVNGGTSSSSSSSSSSFPFSSSPSSSPSSSSMTAVSTSLFPTAQETKHTA